MAHLNGEDTAPLLDELDCHAVADALAATLAGIIRRHGGDPDAFAAMLATDTMRRAAPVN